ncbi:MAG: cellulase family glycosylhydrolase [Alphaproteobacteria bacterium]|nr:cellulase family glycosylhydrolase [Alphaproteobacteria bacterium]
MIRLITAFLMFIALSSPVAAAPTGEPAPATEAYMFGANISCMEQGSLTANDTLRGDGVSKTFKVSNIVGNGSDPQSHVAIDPQFPIYILAGKLFGRSDKNGNIAGSGISGSYDIGANTMSIRFAKAPAKGSRIRILWNNGGKAWINYCLPTPADMKYLCAEKGLCLLRIPISWTRTQQILKGELNEQYMSELDRVFSDAASVGAKIIIDLHSYGSWQWWGLGGTDTTDDDFADVWQKIAKRYTNNPALYGYDLMNEPVCPTCKAPALISAYQAAIRAIRTVDPNSYIYAEGTCYSGAHSWLTCGNDALKKLIDPSDKLIFNAHAYPDHNNSGTNFHWPEESARGVTAQTLLNRYKTFVEWCNKNGKKCAVTETGTGRDAREWLSILDIALDYLRANHVQFTYWSAGAWFGDGYNYSINKRSDGTDTPQMSILTKYTGKGYPASLIIKPLAKTKVTVTGSVAAGNKIKYTVSVPTQTGLYYAKIDYQTSEKDTVASIAAAIGNGINNDKTLAAQSITADSSDNIVTISHPAYSMVTFRHSVRPTSSFSVSQSDPQIPKGIEGAKGVTYPLTVTYPGYLQKPMTVTFTDGGRGGTFSPPTLTLSGTYPSANFSYTLAATGTIGLTATTDNSSVSAPVLPVNTTPSDFSAVKTARAINICSVRKLYPLYSGPLMKLRRSSDDTAQDFYPADMLALNSTIDTQAVSKWAAGSKVYVDTCYDQGPDENHFTQADKTLQPMFIYSCQNKKPCMRFESSSLKDTSKISKHTGQTLLFAAKTNRFSSTAPLIQWFNNQLVQFGPQAYALSGESSLKFSFVDVTAWHIYSGRYKADSSDGMKVYKDGKPDAQGKAKQLSIYFQYAPFGATLGYGTNYLHSKKFFDGDIGEVIIFDNAISDDDLSAFHASQKLYWATP